MAPRRRYSAPDYAGMGEKMVKSGLAILTLLIFTAILIGCGLFSASPFSSNLPFVAAFVNLGDRLDSFLEDRRFDEVDYLFHTIRDDWERDVLFLLFRQIKKVVCMF